MAEFCHTEQVVPIDQSMQNRNQKVDVNTIRQWIIYFSNGKYDVCDKLCSEHNMQVLILSW